MPSLSVRRLIDDVGSVDKVGVEARAASFTTRSIKKNAKLWGLRTAVSMVDLTTLEGQDTPGKIAQICAKALVPHAPDPDVPPAAAVCVYPALVREAKRHVAGSSVRVASVATGFPSGQAPLKTRLAEVRGAVADGADEIDMVINRNAFLSGRVRETQEEITAVLEACGDTRLKVILETGELDGYDQIRAASFLAMRAGLRPGDFIKTSTGKTNNNATLANTQVMLEAIRDHYLATGVPIGMKPAGGIRTAKLALHFLVAVKETLGDAWLTNVRYRFGASALLNDLLRQMEKERTGVYQAGYVFSEAAGRIEAMRAFLIALALTVFLAHARAAETTAAPTSRFLDSIGVNTTLPDRGQPLDKTIEMIRYGGFRWVRGGIEGLTDHGPTTLQTYLDLHRATGVRFSWGLVSGGTDVGRLVATAKALESAGALLAFEGNNEPNNWGVTYQGEEGGGKAPSWLAVAKLQRDLYRAVKSEPMLKKYPVWSISCSGAQRDNVGLQFLTIPAGAGTLLPDGTPYADAANCHNYFYHPNSAAPADNQTWNAADPSPACRVDGLYGNFGVTWAKKFSGYPQAGLDTLPRVTTETGATIEGAVTEQIQGLNLLSLYLDQFKRGWSHTAVYLLRDRTDEGGNQAFGFYDRDYRPRKAAAYLHSLTTILADGSVGDARSKGGSLDYTIADPPATVHDLLLQRGDGTFQLIVWNERLSGEDKVVVHFGAARVALKIYDPTVGVEPTKTLADARTLELTLSDHPLVVLIR